MPKTEEKASPWETEKPKTYKISYKCSNCGSTFDKNIPKGTKAHGNGGECPYCGIIDADDPYDPFKVIPR